MKNMEYLGCEMMNLKESIPKCNLLEVSLEKEILKISLNRIDVFNALNPELIQELIDIFSWAANNCAATAHSLVSESGEAKIKKNSSQVSPFPLNIQPANKKD